MGAERVKGWKASKEPRGRGRAKRRERKEGRREGAISEHASYAGADPGKVDRGVSPS